MNTRPRAASAAALASLIVIGLSGPAAAASEVPAPGVSDATIITYLDALDTVDASPALAVSSPRSAAFRYAEHQVAFEQARRETGLDASVDVITPQGAGRFQLCTGETTSSCPVFAEFTADRAGLISAFTVDGVDITPRVGDPSDPVAFGPVTARIRSSYRTVRSDALIVTLEVTVTSDFSTASVPGYTDPAGRNVAAIDGLGPTILLSGSSSTLALIFEAVDPGGRLVWGLSPATGGDPTVLDTAVPALLAGAELAVPLGAATTTTLPGTTVPVTAATVASELTDSLGPTLEISGIPFIDPDEACLGEAIETLPPPLRQQVDALVREPSLFHSLDDKDAAAIALAFVGCVAADELPKFIAVATTRAVEQLPCLADAWADIVTPTAVASSLAYGHGLDDLPDDVVDAMTLTATTCVPDREWWIAEEAFTLARFGIEGASATCNLRLLVDTFGVEPIIRRRVLTLDLWPVARSDLQRLDFIGRCNAPMPDPAGLDVEPGTCLSGFGSGPGNTHPVDCAQSHNAEVVSVTDLSAEFPTWPGAEVVRTTAGERCFADVQALGDATGYASGWDIPNRLAWERSHRALTCVLIRPGFESWTGPAGLVTESPPLSPATTGKEMT